MAILTLQQLETAGACADQRALFARHFGEQVDVTPELAESVADLFAWDWAARVLLPAPAYAEFKQVRAAAWEEFDRIRDTARAEFDRIRDAAYADYGRITAPAWADYERIRARAFARLYNRE